MHDDQVFLMKLCLRSRVFVSGKCWDKYRKHPDSCLARATALGECHGARGRYLTWLRAYLAEQGDPWVPVSVARDLDEADAVVTLRNYYKRKPAALRDAESNGVPIYVLKTNTILQMENMLASLFDLEADPQEAALRETAEAIGLVQASGRPVELAPQNAYVRRLQHQMAERANLVSRSRGREPYRRVRLYPDAARSSWR
mgnify:CR=1 FL=1